MKPFIPLSSRKKAKRIENSWLNDKGQDNICDKTFDESLNNLQNDKQNNSNNSHEKGKTRVFDKERNQVHSSSHRAHSSARERKRDKSFHKKHNLKNETFHGWNSRFTLEEMPSYNPKRDAYLKKMIPIDSFGAYGKLEKRPQRTIATKRDMHVPQSPNESSNIRSNSARGINYSIYMHQGQNSVGQIKSLNLHELKGSKRSTGSPKLKKIKTKTILEKKKSPGKRKKLHDPRPISQLQTSRERGSELLVSPIHSKDYFSMNNIPTSASSARTIRDLNSYFDRDSLLANWYQLPSPGNVNNQVPVGSIRGLQSLSRADSQLGFSDAQSVISTVSSETNTSESTNQLFDYPLFTAAHKIQSISYFSELITDLKKLWKELDIPESERMDIIFNHFQTANRENCITLERERDRLYKLRDITLQILKSIEHREETIRRMRFTCEGFENSEITNRILLGAKLLSLYQSILESSVIITDIVTIWKHYFSLPKPFLWNNLDYIQKMETDMKWFEEGTILRRIKDMGIDFPTRNSESDLFRQRPHSGNLLLKSLPTQQKRILNLGSRPAALKPIASKKSTISPIQKYSKHELSFNYHSPTNSQSDSIDDDILSSWSEKQEAIGDSLQARHSIDSEVDTLSTSSLDEEFSIHSSHDEKLDISESIIYPMENNIHYSINITAFEKPIDESMDSESASILFNSALTIQLLYRRWKARKLMMEAKRIQAAILIQRCWRRYLLNKSTPNLLATIQKSKDIERSYLDEFKYVDFVYNQFVRYCVAIKEYKNIAYFISLTVFAQSVLRRSMAMQHTKWKHSFQKNGIVAAAKFVQCVFRMLQNQSHSRVKRITLYHIPEIKCLQTCLRRQIAIFNLQKLQMQKMESEKLKLAIYYQNFAKCILARRKVEDMKRQKNQLKLIIHLQSSLRRMLQIENYQKLKKLQQYERFALARQLIESFLVRHIAKQRIYKESFDYSQQTLLFQAIKEEQAALTIQCWFRFWKAKRIVQSLKPVIQHKHSSATRIQAIWRGYRCRKYHIPALVHENETIRFHIEKMKHASILLQSVIRKLLTRYSYKQELERQKNILSISATVIQCWFRCLQAQKVRWKLAIEHSRLLELYLRREHATSLIQGAWRAYKKRVFLKSDAYFTSVREKVPIIQRSIRIYQARKRLASIKNYQNKQLEKYLQQELAAVVIQCAFRKYKATIYVHNAIYERRKSRYLPVLERTLSMWAKKYKIRKFQKKYRAATVLQSHARTFLVHFYIYDAAARKIQKILRQAVAKRYREQFIEWKQQIIESVRFVQITLRSNFDTNVKFIHAEYSSVEIVQRINAVCKIQQCFRCYLAKNKLKNLKDAKRNNAARKIQLQWRLFISKKTVQTLRAENLWKRNQKLIHEELSLWEKYQLYHSSICVQKEQDTKFQEKAILQHLTFKP